MVKLLSAKIPDIRYYLVLHGSKAFKSLGFVMRLDQSMHDQFVQLQAKCLRLANAISSSTVNRREAFLTYFAVFQPATSYVLSLSTFTPTQCHQISSKPTSMFLQKCGFSSKTKCAVVFGSRSSGGIGFRSLYTGQGIQHAQKFVQCLRTPGLPKDALTTSLLWWQILAGALTVVDHHFDGHPLVPSC